MHQDRNTILDDIRSSMEHYPEYTAMVYRDVRLSYGELDVLTGKIAGALREKGIGRGSVVSVLVSRGEWMMPSAIGILRTGAAYQPLSAEHPKERIRFMVQDASPKLIIIDREYAPLLAGCGVSFLYTDEIMDLPVAEEEIWAEPEIEDPFVLLYTSGSTGTPKGVVLSHGNLLSFGTWFIPYYEVDAQSHMGQHPSFVFDMHLAEMILPLMAGAAVYIIPDEIRTDLTALGLFADQYEITHLSMTTQLGRLFAMTGAGKSLKHLTVAGEALSSVRPPEHCTLHNVYGPTEGWYLTVWKVEREYSGNVPIGEALPDVILYVVDEEGRLCRDGEIGELCVSGRHLALGYLNQPELTKKAFTENPFSDDPELGRMYHTGDLVKRDADGVYYFYGRRDRQIKLRGFRIEPGEIEAVMNRIPGVRDAVVTVVKEGGEIFLAGYYLAGEETGPGSVREFVEKNLPDYMVPSVLIRMDAFPLNTNGKVDHKKLPKPDRRDLQETYEEPQTETERIIASAFAELLSLEQVGRKDDFIHLGGHSLLAVELSYRLGKELDTRIRPVDILMHPVLEELSAFIDANREDNDSPDAEEEVSLYDIRPTKEEQGLWEKKQLAPVTAAQKRMVTAQEILGERDTTYLLMVVLSVDKGASRLFSAKRIYAVLEQLLLRHESLRTSFVIENGRWMQRVAKEDPKWIKEAVEKTRVHHIKEIYQGTGGTTDGNGLALQESMAVSLYEAPLFRWELGEEEDRVSVSFLWHHSISDGRSMMLFCQEFLELLSGKTPGEQPLNLRQMASWEKKRRQSGQYKKLFAEALKHVREGRQGSGLFADHLSLPDGLHTAGHVFGLIPKEVSDQVAAFCHGNGYTEYMFYLAVYALLLQKSAVDKDWIIGTVMDGRQEPGTERMQGMLVNTVPLVMPKEDAFSSFTELLDQIKDEVLFAYAHQEIDVEELAQEFSGARTAHGHLFFDVLFVMQSFEHDFMVSDNAVDLSFPASHTAMFDLSLETEVAADGCHLDFEYDASLFERESIEQLAKHYQCLIQAAVTEPQKAVLGLSMIDEEEKQKLLVEFQGKKETSPKDTVITQIRRVAGLYPTKAAVFFENQELSYEELIRESGRLAAWIRDQIPVEKREEENRIVLFMERGLSMIVGILGVLQAGASYVPVSPEYPAERIRFILSDCEPVMVLYSVSDPQAKEGLLSITEELHLSAEEIFLDRESRKVFPGTDAVEEPREVPLDAPAYMIYTSGTTGTPKGVLVEHRQLSHLLSVYTDIYQMSERDCVLQFASFVFDQSVWDIFHVLACGGTLCLITPEMSKDPELLSAYCQEKGVTAMSLTPGLLRTLSPEQFPKLRMLDVGGEAPDEKLLRKWSANHMVFNTYGPTETTVNATSYLFSDGNGVRFTGGERVPIGRPIPNTHVYVLSGDSLSGILVPGELCISGDGVAREYFKRPELTGEKFVTDPFTGGKMYRSGDLARILPDGNIDFLGRIDHQVKIRGYRIEPEEIENRIRDTAGVTGAAVLPKTDPKGNLKLCGYYTGSIGDEALREELKKSLPEYMVPAKLFKLEQFPLTVNGKLDRKGLPEPVWSEEVEFLLPETKEEEDCLEVWKEVLMLDRIGVTEDFLELGGDSIQAILIVTLLREKGYRVTNAQVLQSQTIRGLARHLKKAEKKVYQEERHVIRTPVIRDFFAEKMPKPNHYNQSALFRIQGAAGKEMMEKILIQIVRRHGMLRMIFADGEIQIRDKNDPVFLHMDIREWQGISLEERERICDALQREMDISKGIVMRAALFRMEKEEIYLFLAFHHLVIDEVSWQILTEELNTLFSAELSGKKPPELNDTISFGEWAKALWAYRSSERFFGEQAYWTKVHEKLEKSSLKMEHFLSAFRKEDVEEPGAEPSFSTLVKVIPFATEQITGRVDAVLLAALAETIKKEMKEEQEDGEAACLPVWMESHGRGDIGEDILTDRTIGWFTAVYPICVTDTGIPAVSHMLENIPNFGMGWGLLYGPQNGGVIFNYLGEERIGKRDQTVVRTELSCGEELAAENGERQTISFDLRMTVKGLVISCRYDTVFDSGKVAAFVESYAKLLDKFSKNERRSEVMAVCRPTPLQLGMFFHAKASPEQRAYVIQDRISIHAKWDAACFKEALELLSMRYDALRMRFVLDEAGEVRQELLRSCVPEFTEEQIEKSLDRIAERELDRGFDLTGGSLLRAVAVPSGKNSQEEGAEIILTVSHLIVDGWSSAILTEKLMSYYRMLSEGNTKETLLGWISKERETYCSFQSYLHFLESDFQKQRAAGLREWEHYLEGYEESVGIPSFPAYTAKKKGIQRMSLVLEAEQIKELDEYCTTQHLTRGMFFSVLWGLLLQAENGTTDVVFGSVVSGRGEMLSGIEETVGMLINTVPVRIQGTMDTRVSELMKQRREEYLKLLPYEKIPLGEIQEQTIPGRMLIQTLFAYENYPQKEEAGAWYVAKTLREETNYPVNFVVEEGKGLSIELLYDAAKIPESYAALIINRAKHLIGQIVKARKDSLTLGDLERRPDNEQEAFLEKCSGEEIPYPADNVLELLWKNRKLSPDGTAVSMDGKKISYEKLWKASSCLAEKLSDIEMPPGDRFVVLLTDRGFDMIAAIWGTLLAGAAYVPVDPDIPVVRFRTMLLDCKPVAVILSVKKMRREAQALLGELSIPVMDLGKENVWREDAGKEDRNAAVYEKLRDDIPTGKKFPGTFVGRELPAYMIYTSGTTGRPKGVVVSHESLLHMVCANTAVYGSFEKDVVLQLANYVFDQSVWDIFQTLCNGGTLCLISRDTMQTAEGIEAYMRENQVTVLMTTTALLETLHPDQAGKLRMISAGGDAANLSTFAGWKDSTELLFNSYGPTEATVNAAAHLFTGEEEEHIPIGKLLPGKELFLMQGNKLCGFYQKGEIAIGGRGLARGYLHREDLTEKAFVKRPDGKGRYYLTGDLGRLLPDGSMVFEGRKDGQIKLRGFRIETAEIESHLLEAEGIREAAVVLRQAGASPYLAAFFTASSPVDITFLQEYLQSQMPDYMVPKRLIQVERIPHNASGKIDTRRLLALEPAWEEKGGEDTARNYFEEQAANLFSEVLGIESVGRNDSFFELGGSSLDVMRLVSRLGNPHIHVADILMRPTPAAIGSLMMADFKRKQVEQNDLVLLREGEESAPALFCLPPSGGMTMCYLDVLSELAFPGRIYGLTDDKYRIFGELEKEELLSYVRKLPPGQVKNWNRQMFAVFLQHIRKEFQSGDYLMGYSQGGSYCHRLAQVLEEEGKTVGGVFMLEAEPVLRKPQDQMPDNRELFGMAVDICFGNRETGEEDKILPEYEAMDEAVDVTQWMQTWLDRRMRAEPVEREILLRSFLETYLVLACNIKDPLITEGRIKAKIHAVLLEGKGGNIEKTWERFSVQPEQTEWLGKDYQETAFMSREHVIFLSKYRREIAALLERWLR